MQQGLNMAHHGARLYLPDLGYFASPDPLAELDPGVSPYTYCAGDPANFSDNTGLYATYKDAFLYAVNNGYAPDHIKHMETGPRAGEWYVFASYGYYEENIGLNVTVVGYREFGEVDSRFTIQHGSVTIPMFDNVNFKKFT